MTMERRVGVIHRADGTTEEIPVDVPQGFFQPGTDELHRYRGSGWQNVDDEHPSGTGELGYRIAYKTLKLIPDRDVLLGWPNLRISFGVGTLNRGGVKTPDAVEGRQPNSPVVPEFGTRLALPGGGVSYLGCPDRRMTFEGWEETLGGLSYVEILYRLPDGMDSDADAARQAGRSAVASIKTILDLTFGPRLLGLPLLEEIGELFDDWHWNRRLDSASLATELQLRPQIVEGPGFIARAAEVVDHQQGMSETERRRFRLASQWYWLADAEPDPVNKFLQLWLVIESLEMKTSDVAPVKARLGYLLGIADSGPFVGRLFGLRSKIVHGNVAEVEPEQLHQVDVLARMFLLARLNHEPLAAHVEQLRKWVAAT